MKRPARLAEIAICLGLTLWICLLQLNWVASAAEKLSSENDLYSVELLSHTAYPDFKLVFRIEEKTTHREREFSIKARFLSVTSLSLLEESKFLVIGKLPRGGNIISIVNGKAGRLQDTIWNYGYSVSPSGRLLIYRTHYPGMGLPAYRRSIVLLYDLLASAADNRPPSISNYSRENAGLPVFPEKNKDEASYNIMLEPRHYYPSPFLWSEDDSRVVFTGFSTQDQQNYLVVIQVGGGVSEVSIRKSPISAIDYVVEGISEATRKQLEMRYGTRPFSLRSLRWKGPEEVVATLSPLYWLPKEITIKLPEKPYPVKRGGEIRSSPPSHFQMETF